MTLQATKGPTIITTTTATTTVVPLAPFVEAQGLTKVPGVSFALHGTLFARGHHRGHQKCPRQPRVPRGKLLLSLMSVC
jgi:hypothetical protein